MFVNNEKRTVTNRKRSVDSMKTHVLKTSDKVQIMHSNIDYSNNIHNGELIRRIRKKVGDIKNR